MKNQFLWMLACALFACGGVGCSDDGDAASDPAGTLMLNMLDEQNGKTLLEDSGIYIDKASNFVSRECCIFGFGRVSGLGTLRVSAFENPASQAAVQTGYGYAAVRPAALVDFPSGRKALDLGIEGVNYLKFYVVAPLVAEDKTVGAAVKYCIAQPRSYNLPRSESTVVSLNWNSDPFDYTELGQKVAYTLPSDDCEYVFDAGNAAVICEKKGRRLLFSLEEWAQGRYPLYLRIGESCVKVYVEVR